MKRGELMKHANCNVCHHPIGNSGLPLFWKVTVERFGIDMKAVKRQAGLDTFLGSPALGAVMGLDEDLASRLHEPVTVTVCETCGMADTMVALLAECGVQG